MTKQTLSVYAQEILPNVREILKRKEMLNDWKKTDAEALAFQVELSEVNERYKKYVEETEATLLREIKDLETDVKMAIKAAAKGSEYKPAQLKQFFVARAKQKVEEVVEKAELYEKLTGELDV